MYGTKLLEEFDRLNNKLDTNLNSQKSTMETIDSTKKL